MDQEELKNLVRFPEVASRYHRDQMSALKSIKEGTNYSYKFRDLSHMVAELGEELKRLPPVPKQKSVWLPMIVLSFLVVLTTLTASLLIIWHLDKVNERTVLEKLSKSTLTSELCNMIGFESWPQSDGRVYCAKHISPANR